jgi:5-methylcytosine-specific restriction endonuclease McrA
MKVKSDLCNDTNAMLVSVNEKMPNPFMNEYPPIQIKVIQKKVEEEDDDIVVHTGASDDDYKDCLSDCSKDSDTYTLCLKNMNIIDDEPLTDEDEEVPPTVEKNTKQLSKHIRHRLWDRYFDTTYGTCYVCGREITILSFGSNIFEAGHVIARSKGGTNDIKNLRPVCGGCNKNMRNTDLREFQKEFYPNIPKLYPRRRLKP